MRGVSASEWLGAGCPAKAKAPGAPGALELSRIAWRSIAGDNRSREQVKAEINADPRDKLGQPGVDGRGIREKEARVQERVRSKVDPEDFTLDRPVAVPHVFRPNADHPSRHGLSRRVGRLECVRIQDRVFRLPYSRPCAAAGDVQQP